MLSLNKKKKRGYHQFDLIRFSIEQFHSAIDSQSKYASLLIFFSKCNICAFAICNRNVGGETDRKREKKTIPFNFDYFEFIFFYWRHFIWISIAVFFAFMHNRIFLTLFIYSILSISHFVASVCVCVCVAHSTKCIWIIKHSRTFPNWKGKKRGETEPRAHIFFNHLF